MMLLLSFHAQSAAPTMNYYASAARLPCVGRNASAMRRPQCGRLCTDLKSTVNLFFLRFNYNLIIKFDTSKINKDSQPMRASY